MGFFRGLFCEDSLDVGRVLWEASFDALVFEGVESHANEEEKRHCHDAKGVVAIVVLGCLEKEEQEGKDGTTEDEQHHEVHVPNKKIRPNHTQREGDDEANKGIVLPRHHRLFNSLIRASGFSALNT